MKNTLPALPRLVLRVGFAGNQNVAGDTTALDSSLDQIIETLAHRLAQIAPGTPINAPTPESRIHRFYSKENPVLRLVTGLCQGGDSLAADALERLGNHETLSPHVITELAAVIPYDLPVYRSSRPVDFLPEFDKQAERCSYILTLDGIYEKPIPETPLAKSRRARAYRAQSALLLRQADIIIAATDPDVDGRAGGTMETVRAALEFDLPVVFLHTGTGRISLIEPGDDPASTFAALSDGEDDWQQVLRRWVTTIVADPDVDEIPEAPSAQISEHETVETHGEKLLNEFFRAEATPPLVQSVGGKFQAKTSQGSRLWSAFEDRFRSGAKPKSDPSLQPYKNWRDRSTSLNYHYSGLYRGAFFLNYLLAATAVLLAALSLVLLSYAPHEQAKNGSEDSHVGAVAEVQNIAENATSWVFPVLLILGALKLGCVWTIYQNTHRANHGDWNDKAVDYRYLAERLRTMYYLPRIGSFQPPVAAPPQYASRVVRQSAVDWLLDAIVRSTSPAALPSLQRESFTFGETTYEASILRLEPTKLLADVRDSWIIQQTVYHDRNARTMDRIQAWAENWGKVFNLSVIAFVAIDVIFVIVGLIDKKIGAILHHYTPWLVFLAAVLPAAVASLNGIRFQSECRRLAERSAVMRAILSGRSRKTKPEEPKTFWAKLKHLLWHRPLTFIQTLFPFASQLKLGTPLNPMGSKLAAAEKLQARMATAASNPSTDLASWTPEVLRLSESVASVFVQEVAEWSVLYAKEVPEP